MSSTLVDGVPGESIGSTDRGLHYGDGLFETISCHDGRARWLSLHLERLRHGCERLRLPFHDYRVLEQEIAALADGQQRCLVKAIITRGLATRRGYGPAGDERPTRIVSRHPWPQTPQRATPGFRVGISGVRLGTNPALAGLKHLNRLEQVLAQIALAEDGLDEVLMMSSADRVIGGSMSNVFFADQSGLFTPLLTDCGVAGVMRRLVLQTAGKLGIQVHERAVACAELNVVRAAFVTNVRWGLQPVDALAGRALERTDHAQRLWNLIDAARS